MYIVKYFILSQMIYRNFVANGHLCRSLFVLYLFSRYLLYFVLFHYMPLTETAVQFVLEGKHGYLYRKEIRACDIYSALNTGRTEWP